MSWKLYEVMLRLRAPMHIGCGKVGNMQRTRWYVSGRSLWGALALRLTRDRAGRQPAVDSAAYREVGEIIHNSLAYTYFYPAVHDGSEYKVIWPWQEGFAGKLLSSYGSTALSYPNQCAEEGSLHEVEFISPRTVDVGEEVFLLGYIFDRDCPLDWQCALRRIQLGAERCYGWGAVEPIRITECPNTSTMFGGAVMVTETHEKKPNLRIGLANGESGVLLAHANCDDLNAQGEIEPLVGREWRSDNAENSYAGQHVEFSGVFFKPGSLIMEPTVFEVGRFGIWRKVN